MAYLLEKVTKNSAAGSILGTIFSSSALASESGHTGLIISERLINMPPQIMPPMYKMLGDEIQWALDEVWLNETWSAIRVLTSHTPVE
jgi:protein BCP1